MLGLITRVLTLADDFAHKLKLAFLFSFFEGIFANMPFFALFYILTGMVDKTIATKDVWISTGMLISGLLGRYIFKRLVQRFQDAVAYEIFERERITMGDRLKRFPMGFFSEGNMGNVSTVITSDISFIETFVINSIDKVVVGYVSMTIGAIFLLILDYRIALISICVWLLSAGVLQRLQAIARKESGIRQKQQGELVSAVLEYVQGIAVIKAFNMTGEKSKATKDAFEKTRDNNIRFEKKFITPAFAYELCFYGGIALTVFAASRFCLNGSLDISVMLMLVIFIFQFYLPLKALGPLTVRFRVMEAGLDKYEALKNTGIIDNQGKDIRLDTFDIEFDNVGFAYEETEILKNMSFRIPEKSMTALVGRSGSGKTTIANLIARFWDVQQGEVRVGGVNVKEMTCDSLLAHISMVFQKVYLFNDTILNNIKFGKPDASFKEIVAASKQARCHDFIMALEKGYDTIIGEGGATLSGGEKQRISIARAMLKDAPIVLLDEATASMDPDNEKHIQAAISRLVRDKTLVVIAHRLSTIKNADQILVIDDGKIVQKGNHARLVAAEGPYRNFWERRTKASTWKIKGRKKAPQTCSF